MRGCFSTSLSSQVAQQSSSFDTHSLLIIGRIAVGRRPISQLSLRRIIRRNQIPLAPAAQPPLPTARFPPLEAFVRRPRARGAVIIGPELENFTIAVIG